MVKYVQDVRFVHELEEKNFQGLSFNIILHFYASQDPKVVLYYVLEGGRKNG